MTTDADGRHNFLLRDQRRALHAYKAVGSVPKAQQKDYEAAVNDFGANLLQSGLCAALAGTQRLGSRGVLLLEHLATAGVPGFEGIDGSEMARRARELDVDSYIIATREILLVTAWLKRAAQATFE